MPEQVVQSSDLEDKKWPAIVNGLIKSSSLGVSRLVGQRKSLWKYQVGLGNRLRYDCKMAQGIEKCH